MKRIVHYTRLHVRTITFAGACALFATAPIRAQGSDCAKMFAASSRMLDVPYHVYMIDSAKTDAVLNHGKPRVGEVISAGGEMYVLSHGKWVKSPVSAAEMKKMRQENTDPADQPKVTCSHLRDESVNGEAASVWRSHTVNAMATIDADVWISKSRGVLLKSNSLTDVGGPMGKSRSIARYDYTNVRPPAGVP